MEQKQNDVFNASGELVESGRYVDFFTKKIIVIEGRITSKKTTLRGIRRLFTKNPLKEEHFLKITCSDPNEKRVWPEEVKLRGKTKKAGMNEAKDTMACIFW